MSYADATALDDQISAAFDVGPVGADELSGNRGREDCEGARTSSSA